MAPRDDDLILTDRTDALFPEPRSRRRWRFYRISPRRLMKMWRARSDKAVQSVSSLRKEQPTHDASVEHLRISDLYAAAPVGEVTVIDESAEEKVEVTVIDESAEDNVKQTYFARKNKRHEIAEAEGREYLQQLNSTKELVDTLTKDLVKSRNQTGELISQNIMLLEELKAVAGKDDATIGAHRMLRQELNILKGCLFFSAIFIFLGGRADLLSLFAMIWMVADISA